MPSRTALTLVVVLVVLTAGCLSVAPMSDDPTTEETSSSTADGTDAQENEQAEESETTNDSEADGLPDGDEILDRLTAGDMSIADVHGIRTTTIDDGEEVRTSTYEVWERPPAEHRMELIETDQAEEFDVMVSNGTTVWLYDTTENEAVHMALDFGQADLDSMNDGLFEGMYDSMDATVMDTEVVADRETYVLELTADGPDPVYETVTLWVDKETYYPLKETSESAVTELTTTNEFEEVAIDDGIEDETFTFEPPEGATIHDSEDLMPEEFDDIETAAEEVPFDIPEPELPEDEELQLSSVMVQENLAGTSVTLQYASVTEWPLVVSVSDSQQDSGFATSDETVDLGPAEATVTELPGSEAVVFEWEQNDLTYSVSGELDFDVLVEIAESIAE